MVRYFTHGILMTTLLLLCTNSPGISQSLNVFNSRQNSNWIVSGSWERFNGISGKIAANYLGNKATNKLWFLLIVTQDVNFTIPNLKYL